ncbi:hypothetical protein O3P69_003093 [Scylla paramamosain]|uniref:Cuticle protein n=1 Tax=Scylla paramamosain TaxID=85552 RepID=A0AAW0UKF0_SCYPA
MNHERRRFEILVVISAAVPVLSAPQFPSLEGSSTTPSSLETSVLPRQVTKETVNPRSSSFNYRYHVNAQDTGDEKSHQEIFENGAVVGSYSVVQPDGILRIVTYRADKHSGF